MKHLIAYFLCIYFLFFCFLNVEDEVYTRSSSVEHILRDVHINVKYNISIAAVTSHGNSSYSDSSFVEVKPSGETGEVFPLVF